MEGIYKRRQQLPGMDAMYFMQPTKENIIMFLSDISGRKPLYREFTGSDLVLPQGSNSTSSQSLSQGLPLTKATKFACTFLPWFLALQPKCNHGAVFNHPRPPPSQRHPPAHLATQPAPAVIGH